MIKSDFKKYDYGEIEEIEVCNHCLKKFKFLVKFHYEDKPKKGSDNRIILPLEMIKTRYSDVSIPSLCLRCKQFKKCEDCGVILCNWKPHDGGHSSKMNPLICIFCQLWRDGGYPQVR